VSARDDALSLNAAALSNQTPAPTAGRILVVDDHESNLHLLSRLLMRDGHVVDRACTGQEALERVSREQPDLVLLDVVMPGMSGFDACRELKRQPSTRLIPVVLITTLRRAEDRIQGIEAGADDFLTKPVNPHELRARVRSLLRIKRYTDDLDSAHQRATEARARELTTIERRPWGERSFYCVDPDGNRLCFVDDATLFLGRGADWA